MKKNSIFSRMKFHFEPIGSSRHHLVEIIMKIIFLIPKSSYPKKYDQVARMCRKKCAFVDKTNNQFKTDFDRYFPRFATVQFQIMGK